MRRGQGLGGLLRYCLMLMLTISLFSLWPLQCLAADSIKDIQLILQSGKSADFRFRQQVYEYTIYLDKEQLIQVTISAPGCQISDGDRKSADSFTREYQVSDGDAIFFDIYTQAEEQLSYAFHFRVSEQEAPPQPPASGDEKTPPGNQADSGPGTSQPENTLPEEYPEADEYAAEIWPGEELGEQPAGNIHLQLQIGFNYMFHNNEPRVMDAAPFMLFDEYGGGYTMVPVRFISEALGAAVGWDAGQRIVSIVRDDTVFLLKIGENVPGTPVAAMIRDSRTFVPLRYVMETLGAEVYWDGETRQIDIYYWQL